MAIKLIALDIDGTLVNTQMEVTEGSIHALNKAVQQGIRIVLSTGRPEVECDRILEKLPCIDYINGCTGARVVELKTGRLIAGAYISSKETKRLYDAVRDLDLMFCVLDPDAVKYYAEKERLAYSIAHASPQVADHLSRYYVGVDSMDEYLASKDQFIKIYMPCFTREALEAVKSRLAAEPYIVLQCAPQDMEISPPGIDKGSGLAQLAQALGFSADEVMAIGDSENDLGMLRYAGLPVVMGNGSADAKALAKYITDDNDHEGVAKAVNMVLEGTL